MSGPRGRRRIRDGLARLGDARRRLRRTEGVESEDAFDLGCHRRVDLGRRRVVVAGLVPSDRRYFEIGVEKADCTWATVPETGSDRPVADGCPDRQALPVGGWTSPARSWPTSGRIPARTVSASGSGGTRGRGSDTACTSVANAAGSRGLRVTVSGRDVDVGAGPTRVARGERDPDGRAASRAPLRRPRQSTARGGAEAPPRRTARP